MDVMIEAEILEHLSLNEVEIDNDNDNDNDISSNETKVENEVTEGWMDEVKAILNDKDLMEKEALYKWRADRHMDERDKQLSYSTVPDSTIIANNPGSPSPQSKDCTIRSELEELAATDTELTKYSERPTPDLSSLPHALVASIPTSILKAFYYMGSKATQSTDFINLCERYKVCK